MVVNVEGFVKYSKIYRGNIGEIATLEPTLDDLNSRGSFSAMKPIKLVKVWERIGRLKERYPSAHRSYRLMKKGFGAFIIPFVKLSPFRTLKTDLKMRPVFHKTDENSVAHLNLAVLAYQMVHAIRYQLKAKGINHDWTHIVRIMNTQKAATVTVKDKNEQKIFIRKCTAPEPNATEIYNALGYKHNPFIKKSVLPETVDRKTEPPGTG